MRRTTGHPLGWVTGQPVMSSDRHDGGGLTGTTAAGCASADSTSPLLLALC